MARNLAPSGATFGTGKFGQGLAGGQPYISGQNFTLPITIEAIVQSTASMLQVIVGLTPGFNFYLGLNSDGHLVGSTNSSGSAAVDVVGTRVLNDGALHSVAAVITSSGMTIFSDGITDGNGSQGFRQNNNDTLTIGGLSGSSYPFNGTIDEVRISNIARYSANYTPSATAFTPDTNTLALYHFDGDTNDAAGATGGLGPLNIGWIGDSIPAGTNGNPVQAMADYLTGVGYTPTMTNRAVGGTTTQDWLPGGSYLPGALSAFQSAGVTVAMIGLGTNDARTPLSLTPAQHSANMARIVTTIRASGPKVVINHPIWTLPNAGSSGAQWPADPNTVYKNYFAANMQLTDGTGVFAGDAAGFSLFGINPSYLADGIHPTSSSNPLLGQLWGFGLLYRYGAAGGIPNRWSHS